MDQEGSSSARGALDWPESFEPDTRSCRPCARRGVGASARQVDGKEDERPKGMIGYSPSSRPQPPEQSAVVLDRGITDARPTG